MYASGIVASIEEKHLTTATTDAKYPLGAEYITINTTANIPDKWRYVYAHAALTQYAPYQIVAGGTTGTEWRTAAPATIAANVVEICIPQVAVTSNYYCWVKTQGRAYALTTGPATTIDEGLQVLNGATYFTAGTTGPIYGLSTPCACIVVSTAGNTTATVNLFGYRIQTTG
jgi:hypothetical protein